MLGEAAQSASDAGEGPARAQLRRSLIRHHRTGSWALKPSDLLGWYVQEMAKRSLSVAR